MIRAELVDARECVPKKRQEVYQELKRYRRMSGTDPRPRGMAQQGVVGVSSFTVVCTNVDQANYLSNQ